MAKRAGLPSLDGQSAPAYPASMLRSMTGFGAGRGKSGEEEISVELRSVNGKFCEVKARLPRELAALEPELVKQVKARLHRGVVDVSVKRQGAARGAGALRLDLPLAREYAAAHAQLTEALGLPEGRPRATEILAVEGVLALEERVPDLARAGEALSAALDTALSQLEAMRAREGAALAEDLTARLGRLRELATRIEGEIPAVLSAYQARLSARVAELCAGTAVDPARLAQEVALLAERSDVAEELTRLRSHLDQADQLLSGEAPAGRRLEFLVQEMGREVNTTGSKSQSAAIGAAVVELKAELERIREQAANVE